MSKQVHLDLDVQRKRAEESSITASVPEMAMTAIVHALLYVGDCIRWHGLTFGAREDLEDHIRIHRAEATRTTIESQRY